jgi:hypothetical protein
MFPNSDHNILDPGGWYDSAFAIGGVNWHPLYGGTEPDANQSFIGKIDEVKVWNITKTAGYYDEMVGPVITKVESISTHDKLYVEFSEGVSGSGGSSELIAGDFTYVNNSGGGAVSISSVTHTAGSSRAVITMDSALDAGDINTDTLAADSSIIDEYSTPAFTDALPVTEIVGVPTIDVVQSVVDAKTVAVWFSERVYANRDAAGVLQPDDFVFDDSAGSNEAKTITGVEHIPGDVRVTLTLNDPVDGDGIEAGDLNFATLAAASSSIYDISGYPALTNAVTLTGSTNVSSILTAEGVAGSNKLKVTFESQVYANNNETGALDSSDFTYSGGGSPGATGISAVSHTAGSPVAIITLDAPLDDGGASDIGNDTIAAASNSIFGPSSGNFPLGTGAVVIAGQTAPSITRVEGAVGYNQVYVAFTEGVYTGTGRSGNLVIADFTYADNFGGGSIGINSISHTAGNSTAIITLNGDLAAGDVADTIAAAGSAIFNSADNPASTTPVLITENGCPTWGVSFPIEDEVNESDPIFDVTGLLSGAVRNPAVSFPLGLNDVFTGNAGQDTGVNITNDDACIISPRAMTIEARVKPTMVDNGTVNEFNRIIERQATFLVTMLNTDYRGDDIPSRVDQASIEVKYRGVSTYLPAGSRHYCPHPQWPADPYGTSPPTNDARMHQISSDIDQYPLYNDHWYLIRVVFNSDKADLIGSNGTPVDIFIDDQGTDGVAEPGAGLNQAWSGYKNASLSIRRSSSCKWGALPGDYMEFLTNRDSSIGVNWNPSNSAQNFDGEIDWVTWKPYADYTSGTPAPGDPPK